MPVTYDDVSLCSGTYGVRYSRLVSGYTGMCAGIWAKLDPECAICCYGGTESNGYSPAVYSD